MSRHQAAGTLRSYLDEERFPARTRLPPERELMVRLGMSRRALRQGLEVLEAEGRLWRHVGKGTFVGARPPGSEPGLSFVTARTSQAELMDMCLWLEPTLARVAATRASRLDIDNIAYVLSKSEAARDPQTWDIWDVRLHRAIVQASHNSLALAVYDSLNTVRDEGAWRRLRNDPNTRERFEALSADHSRIVRAIAEHDPPGAEKAMRDHLRSVQNALLLDGADDAEARLAHHQGSDRR